MDSPSNTLGNSNLTQMMTFQLPVDLNFTLCRIKKVQGFDNKKQHGFKIVRIFNMFLSIVVCVVILLAFGTPKIAASTGLSVCTTPYNDASEYSDELKQNFLKGRYAKFFTLVSDVSTALSLEAQSNTKTLLENAYPNGFVECILLGRHEYSKFLKTEIVLFRTDDNEPVFLFLAIGFNGVSWRVMNFHLTTSFREAYNLWK